MCVCTSKNPAEKPDTTASLLIKYSNPITINENSKFNYIIQENNIVFIEIGKIFLISRKETISFNASNNVAFKNYEKVKQLKP